MTQQDDQSRIDNSFFKYLLPWTAEAFEKYQLAGPTRPDNRAC